METVTSYLVRLSSAFEALPAEKIFHLLVQFIYASFLGNADCNYFDYG